MTPDPYRKSARRTNPLSWNRYTYVLGDSINGADPTGLCNIAGIEYTDGLPPCPDITSTTVNGDDGTGMPFASAPSGDGGSGGFLYIEPNIPTPTNIPSCPPGQAHYLYGCDVPLSPQAQQIMQMVAQALEVQLRQAVAIGLSVYAGQAIGGLLEGIAASQATATGASFFDNTTLSESVLEKMASDLTSGGGFHAFPSSVTAFEDAGTVTTFIGNDGATYTSLDISGSYLSPNGNWYDGTFQFIKDSSGTITHWFFQPLP